MSKSRMRLVRLLRKLSIKDEMLSGVAFTIVSTRSCMPLVHDDKTLDPSPQFFIDVPQFLAYLWHRFFFLGGRAFRSKLSSLSDLLSPTTGVRLGLEHVARDGNITELTSGSLTFNASALVNCVGLGALFLGDVNDTAMFPTRGETVLLRAPWITSGLRYAWKNGDMTYIIPHGSGVVVLGGTFQADDLHPSPRPEMVKLVRNHHGRLLESSNSGHSRTLGPKAPSGVLMRGASLGGLADVVHSLPQDAEELFHVMITYLHPRRWSILVWTLDCISIWIPLDPWY
ncbi:hypothetical protein B0H13DRAFT_2475892 [Mycena leptocephala]|nr:hypothetical protein B0H13DRAFT_2475892 [Mycena leptocephala]